MKISRPNDLLRRQRELRGWSQNKISDFLGADSKLVGKWERGLIKPSPYYREKLCLLFECKADELGFIKAESRQVLLSTPNEETKFLEEICHLEYNPSVSITLSDRKYHLLDEDPKEFELCTNLEVRVQCIIYEALSQRISLHELPLKLTRALGERKTIMDRERRKLLRNLALLPIQAFGLNMLGGASPSYSPKDILIHCSAGVTACEHLSKGVDLHLAYSAVSTYVPTLEDIIRNNSSYRKEASELIAQVMLLLATLSLHVEGSKSAIGYAQQAVNYSDISGNLELTLTSLGQLAWIFSSNKQYHKALEKAQLAEHLLKNAQGIHPLVRSNTYAVLGAYSAQNGYRNEALGALNMATQTFFSTTTTDDFNYMDYDYSEILLTWGLAHARTGHPEEALNSFAGIVDPITLATKMPVSERVHIEFLNHMALASVKSSSKDMERTVKYWQAGIEGAKTLQSEQRFNEALTAYEVMEGVWPNDRRIIDLRELVVHW